MFLNLWKYQNWIVYFIGVMIVSIEMVTIERAAIEDNVNGKYQRLLSRRKRYLTFPEGSSVQLGELICFLIETLENLNILRFQDFHFIFINLVSI